MRDDLRKIAQEAKRRVERGSVGQWWSGYPRGHAVPEPVRGPWAKEARRRIAGISGNRGGGVDSGHTKQYDPV